MLKRRMWSYPTRSKRQFGDRDTTVLVNKETHCILCLPSQWRALRTSFAVPNPLRKQLFPSNQCWNVQLLPKSLQESSVMWLIPVAMVMFLYHSSLTEEDILNKRWRNAHDLSRLPWWRSCITLHLQRGAYSTKDGEMKWNDSGGDKARAEIVCVFWPLVMGGYCKAWDTN